MARASNIYLVTYGMRNVLAFTIKKDLLYWLATQSTYDIRFCMVWILKTGVEVKQLVGNGKEALEKQDERWVVKKGTP